LKTTYDTSVRAGANPTTLQSINSMLPVLDFVLILKDREEFFGAHAWVAPCRCQQVPYLLALSE
jgi:hypothetical protein